MKLKFKVQPYQTHAVDALADCFSGQPKASGVSYRIDPVTGPGAVSVTRSNDGALFGTFDLEDAQVSGRFRAEDCGDSRDLFLTLDLLRGEDSPRGDTGA